VLVVTPYYNRPSQAGLVAHFTAVAAATELPSCSTTSRHGPDARSTSTRSSRSSGVPNIIGVKDATGRVDKAADVVLATRGAPGGFDVWSGADEVNLPLLSVGAVGVVSVAAHLAGPEIAEMVAVHDHRSGPRPRAAPRLHAAAPGAVPRPEPGAAQGRAAARGLPAGPVRLAARRRGPRGHRARRRALAEARRALTGPPPSTDGCAGRTRRSRSCSSAGSAASVATWRPSRSTAASPSSTAACSSPTPSISAST
jgi:4-hydroxy-tetrahydrodipicolinate synthase